jgi:F-type H+-transporting ATPase subunit gamma
MEMVAASRLKRVNEQLFTYRPYVYKMEGIFNRLNNLTQFSAHPFLQKREIKNILVIIITSNQGLCGSYNANLIKTMDIFLNKFSNNKIKIIAIGKRGYRYYQKRNLEIIDSFLDFDINLNKQNIMVIYNQLEKLYISKTVDEVYIIYSHFISRMNHKPIIQKILNLEPVLSAHSTEYIVEPEKESFLELFLPTYLLSKLTLYLFESLASEYSARAMAMKIATDNADDLLKELTLQRNKARQAGITKEILDMTSTVEALT